MFGCLQLVSRERRSSLFGAPIEAGIHLSCERSSAGIYIQQSSSESEATLSTFSPPHLSFVPSLPSSAHPSASTTWLRPSIWTGWTSSEGLLHRRRGKSWSRLDLSTETPTAGGCRAAVVLTTSVPEPWRRRTTRRHRQPVRGVGEQRSCTSGASYEHHWGPRALAAPDDTKPPPAVRGVGEQ